MKRKLVFFFFFIEINREFGLRRFERREKTEEERTQQEKMRI